jgi:hypothetical protein
MLASKFAGIIIFLQVKFTTAAVSISSRTFKATTRQLMVPLF